MRYGFTKEQKKVLAGAALFQCALLGVLVNATGILMAQLKTELGIPVSMISAFYMVRSVVEVLGSARLAMIFYRTSKSIFMLAQLLLIVVGYFLLIIGTNTLLWYVSAVMLGFYMAAATIMIPHILGEWFPDNAGFATGTAFACSGIGGVVFNPLMSFLIERTNWKCAVIVLGIVMLVLGSAGLCLIFSQTLDNVLCRDGAVLTEKPGCNSEKVRFDEKFWLSSIVLFSGVAAVQFVQYVGIYLQDAGYSLSVCALITSVIMTGNILGKFLFGILNDVLGFWKTTQITLLNVGIATAGFLLGKGLLPVLFMSALVYGFSYALYTVGVSQCCINVYGRENSKTYAGMHVSVNGIGSILFLMFTGMIYNGTQKFSIVLLLIMGSSVCSVMAVRRLQKRRR